MNNLYFNSLEASSTCGVMKVHSCQHCLVFVHISPIFLAYSSRKRLLKILLLSLPFFQTD